MTAPRLDRSHWPAPVRPVRIVHLGLGNFSRAHQAWYTAAADAAGEWGICAFTGRRPDMSLALAPQQGLYTLIERGSVTDSLSVVEVVSEVRPGSDLEGFAAAVADPRTAIVTLTVTEAGYRPTAAAERAAAGADGAVPSPPERLAAALARRFRGGGGPLAVVSCDNLHANGRVLRERVLAEAAPLGAAPAGWIEHEVSFVSTSVDRITPRVGHGDRELVVRELGLEDAAPVVTEPFRDWVLSGEFPAGRPAWEIAGARFVADVEPWELRKLWLLNGAHSLLAYMGLLRGHGTVAEAIGDRELRAAVEQLWDVAARHLPRAGELGLGAYREQLLLRFANARIGYPLTQVAADGLAKLRQRIAPVIDAARAAGEPDEPALRVVRAWARWLVEDPERCATDQSAQALRRVLGVGDGRIEGLVKLVIEGES